MAKRGDGQDWSGTAGMPDLLISWKFVVEFSVLQWHIEMFCSIISLLCKLTYQIFLQIKILNVLFLFSNSISNWCRPRFSQSISVLYRTTNLFGNYKKYYKSVQIVENCAILFSTLHFLPGAGKLHTFFEKVWANFLNVSHIITVFSVNGL